MQGLHSPVAGTATHRRGGSDGVMCRAADGGSLSRMDPGIKCICIMYTR